jgi:hypothetical protein
MIKPKPCPFCGSTPYIREIVFCDLPAAVAADDGLIEYIKKYRVICDNAVCFCHQQTRLFSTPEKAIEAWNRRVDND